MFTHNNLNSNSSFSLFNLSGFYLALVTLIVFVFAAFYFSVETPDYESSSPQIRNIISIRKIIRRFDLLQITFFNAVNKNVIPYFTFSFYVPYFEELINNPLVWKFNFGLDPPFVARHA